MTETPSTPIVLVIDSDPNIRDLVANYVENEFNAKVILSSSTQEAVSALRSVPNIKCIITDYYLSGGNAGQIYDFIISENKAISFILCCVFPPENFPEFKDAEDFYFSEKPNFFPDLEKTLKKIIGQSQISDPDRNQYCKISVSSLIKCGYLNSDLYVKLNDDKFVKISHQTQRSTPADFEKYISKNIDYLYVPRESFRSVIFHINEQLQEFRRLNMDSGQIAVELSAVALETIREVDEKLGITPEADLVIRSATDLVVDRLGKDFSIGPILENLNYLPKNFTTYQSTVLAYLCGCIAMSLDIRSERILHKLAMASFIHDLSLPYEDFDSFQMYRDSMDLNLITDPVRKFIVRNHPITSANLARKMKGMDPETIDIIEQHEERPDGTGYPKGLKAKDLGPLSRIFIVAEDLSYFIFQMQKTWNIESYIESRKEYFQGSEYQTILQALARKCKGEKS